MSKINIQKQLGTIWDYIGTSRLLLFSDNVISTKKGIILGYLFMEKMLFKKTRIACLLA